MDKNLNQKTVAGIFIDTLLILLLLVIIGREVIYIYISLFISLTLIYYYIHLEFKIHRQIYTFEANNNPFKKLK